MNDLTEALSLNGLIFIAGSIFLGYRSASSNLLHLKNFGQKQLYKYIFHGSCAFFQGLTMCLPQCFPKLEMHKCMLATGEIGLSTAVIAPAPLYRSCNKEPDSII